MRPAQLLAGVVALSSLSAAWPDVFDRGNAVAAVNNVLYGRQEGDNNNADPSESAPPKSTAAPKETAPAEDNNNDEENPKPSNTSDAPKETADPKDKPSATGNDKDNKSTGTNRASRTQTGKASKTPEFDNRLPAGGIQMITPAPLAGPIYYKIGEWVTFAWNYTSLSVTPSAIDILATCTANQATYTLAVNQTVEETGRVLWDTKAYSEKEGAVPLLTEKYTLLVYDSNSEVTAAPRAGYLGVFNQFTFGMYTPQPYVKWKDYTCANCNPNAALSPFESLTLRMLMITCGTTFASLLYFAFSFGVL
jgi:hypothetical protein